MGFLPDNGTLTRIDPMTGATADGQRTWGTGSAIEIRVTIDEPTRSQQQVLGALLAIVSCAIYVAIPELPAGASIDIGDRVVAAQDTQATQTLEVVKANVRIFSGIEHYELFCKKVG